MTTAFKIIDKLQCPLCRQIVPSRQFAGPTDIEPAAVAAIQSNHPDWRPEQGACPNCLQIVLNKLMDEQSERMLTGHNSPAVYGILPVGLRLGYSSAYDGTGITIAFLDSGFSDHPDLAGRIKLYVDASEPEIRELEQVETAGDLSWHGTMTSVVACGNGNLSDCVYRGLASGANVVLIRVSNSEGQVKDEGISRGLAWLLANSRRYGIQIVNISLGGDRPHDFANNPVDLMVEALVSQGILVVCAAGNAGERLLAPPASAPSAVTVGGLDDKNSFDRETNELWHSNYAQSKSGVWKPELVAPSLWLAAPVLPDSAVAQDAAVLEDLLNASREELPGLLPTEVEKLQLTAGLLAPLNGESSPEQIREALRQAWNSLKLINAHYQYVDGTSFAAPIVCSVAAQMWQANPGLSPAGLKDLLMRTARYLPEVAPDQQGHGVIDPWAAVAAAVTTVANPAAA